MKQPFIYSIKLPNFVWKDKYCLLLSVRFEKKSQLSSAPNTSGLVFRCFGAKNKTFLELCRNCASFVIMFGTKALELVKEFQSNKTGALQPYNVRILRWKYDLIRAIIEGTDFLTS